MGMVAAMQAQARASSLSRTQCTTIHPATTEQTLCLTRSKAVATKVSTTSRLSTTLAMALGATLTLSQMRNLNLKKKPPPPKKNRTTNRFDDILSCMLVVVKMNLIFRCAPNIKTLKQSEHYQFNVLHVYTLVSYLLS